MRALGWYNLYQKRRIEEAGEATAAPQALDKSVTEFRASAKAFTDSYAALKAKFEALTAVVGPKEDWPVSQDMKKLGEFFEKDLSRDFQSGRF